MAISLAQHNQNTPAGAGTGTCTYASAQTAGNTNIVFFTPGDGTVTVNSVTDTQGNSYHLVATATGSGGVTAKSFIFAAFGIKSATAGTNVVTGHYSGTPGGGNTFAIWAHEWAGLTVYGTSSSSNNTTSSTTCSAGTITTGSAASVVVAVFGVAGTINGAGGSFTLTDSPDATEGCGVEYEIFAAVQTGLSVTATQTPAGVSLGLAAAFYAVVDIAQTFPDTMPGPRRPPNELGFEAWAPRVAAVAAPTVAYTNYPDMLYRLRAATDFFPSGFDATTQDSGVDWNYPDTMPAARRTPDVWGLFSIAAISTAPTEGYWSFPDRVPRAMSTPDWWALAGRPEERLPGGAEQAFPDRLVRSPTTPDGWTLAGKPERTAPYSDQDFPDRMLRAPSTPDFTTPVRRPEETETYAQFEAYQDQLLRSRSAPDWSPTVGAPERTAPYSDQDFPDRVVRAKPTPDERVLWPFPLPTIAAPVEAYWSYPDRVPRLPTTPDAWEVPPRPERTTPLAGQAYPDRLTRMPATPDWSPTTGRPEEHGPLGWLSYPDELLRARGGPDWSPTQGLPVVVTPTAWASYPDRLARYPGTPDWSPTTGAPEERIDRGWASYPDRILRYSAAPDWTVLGDTRPIATPATPAWFPDVVMRAQATVPWDQAFAPQVIVPSARFIVWLGPKQIIVPVLAGAVILPVLGKPTV